MWSYLVQLFLELEMFQPIYARKIKIHISCSVATVSTANGLFIRFYLSETTAKEPSHENAKNINSPSTEPHVDGRPTWQKASRRARMNI